MSFSRRPIRALLGMIGPVLLSLPPRPYGDEEGDGTDDLKASLSPALQADHDLTEVHNANGADDTSDLDPVDFAGLDESLGDGLGDVTNDEPVVVPDTPEVPQVKTEEVKAPEVAPPAEGEKKDEVVTEEKKEPTVEEEIEKYQPPANANEATRVNFKQIKELWKADKTQVRELSTKVTELEEQLKTAKPPVDEQGQPILPEEIKTRLADLERLEQSVLLEKSPVFAEKFAKPVEEAENGLFEFLKGHGLPDETVEEIKAAGVNGWDKWGELLGKFRDPLNAQKVLRMREAIDDRRSAKQAALEELKSGTSKLPEQLQEEEKAQHMEWGKAAAQGIGEAVKDFDWAKKQEVPEGATDEQKKAIEAHNAEYEKIAQTSRERIIACYNRDPKSTAETVAKSLQADRLSAENTKLQADLKAALARAEELEQRVGAKNRAGRITKADSAPRTETAGGKLKQSAASGEGPDLDDADAAFDRHFSDR